MKKTMRTMQKVVVLVLVFCMVLSLTPITAGATVVIPETAPNPQLPAVAPTSGTYPINNQLSYRESNVTYTGKNDYYLLTQNSVYSGPTVYVIFDGVTGSIVTTPPTTGADGTDWFTINSANVIYTANGKHDGTLFSSKPDSTVFVDNGTYFMTDANIATTGYTAYNLAIVGLSYGDVVLKKQPLLIGNNASSREFHARNTIGNVCLMNLVFDADNIGMMSNTYTGSYSADGGTTWGSGWSGNRGAAFFYVSAGADDVLFRNVEVRNIGAAYDLSIFNRTANYVINMYRDATPGQINIENFTVRNCRGASTDSYRLINVGYNRNVNFKNLEFIQSGGNNRDPIWIENPVTGAPVAAVPNADIRFAGSLEFEGYAGNNRIGIQNTSFGNVTAPDGWRYAVLSVGHTSPTSSFTTNADIFLYKTLDDISVDWGSTDASRYLIFDLYDNAWLVQSSGRAANATVNNQLAGINSVLQKLRAAFNTSGSADQSARGLVTHAYIKLVANDNGEIPSFTVPNFGAGIDVHIKAIAQEGIDEFLFEGREYTPIGDGRIISDNSADDTLVPLAAGAAITNNNSALLRLYNIDFHEKANYTLHETITGLAVDNRLDPSDPDYDIIPDIAAKVTNATADNFVLCRFTVLIQDAALSVDPTLDATITDDDDGKEFTVLVPNGTQKTIAGASLKVSEAYTNAAAGTEHAAPTTGFFPDDLSAFAPDYVPKTVKWSYLQWDASANSGAGDWVTGDDTIATVDEDTGDITAKSAGKIRILGNVLDAYNNGEIPYAGVFYDLNINLTYTVTFAPGTYGAWASTDPGYFTSGLADGATVPAAPTNRPSRNANYVFDKWIYDANNNGVIDNGETTEYSPRDVINGADRQYIATWKSTGGGTQPPDPPIFTDEHWAYIVGYPDGTVRPQGNLTRAEATTVFFRLLTDSVRDQNWKETNQFSDVVSGDWFNNAVSTISYMRIVDGYPNGTFMPNALITRGELATVAARFADQMGTVVTNQRNFTDISDHWAEGYILKAASIGWIKGYEDGTFHPNDPITRAEFATLVNRIMERAPETEEDIITSPPHEWLRLWPDNTNSDAWYYLDIQEATNSHEYTRKAKQVPDLSFYYETWQKLQAPRDWTELEK